MSKQEKNKCLGRKWLVDGLSEITLSHHLRICGHSLVGKENSENNYLASAQTQGLRWAPDMYYNL